MPITPKRMPLLEHIAELRWRVVVVAAVLFFGSMVFYVWGWREVYEWVMAPVAGLLPGKLIVLKPFEPFTFRFKVALYATIVAGSPVYIWQFMAFFLPALKPKERRWFVPTFAVGVLLFLGGVFFCREVILHPAFKWILSQTQGAITVTPVAADYFTGIALFLIGFGAAFELPIVVFYLVVFNIVPYKTLRENWRTVYVALVVVAAAATPDWSPWGMGALSIVLIVLYEMTMLAARILLRKRIRSQRLAEEA